MPDTNATPRPQWSPFIYWVMAAHCGVQWAQDALLRACALGMTDEQDITETYLVNIEGWTDADLEAYITRVEAYITRVEALAAQENR